MDSSNNGQLAPTDASMNFNFPRHQFRPSSGNANAALSFISKGYTNWKDATGEKGAFNSHQRSNCHKLATEVMAKNIGELFSSSHAQEK